MNICNVFFYFIPEMLTLLKIINIIKLRHMLNTNHINKNENIIVIFYQTSSLD